MRRNHASPGAAVSFRFRRGSLPSTGRRRQRHILGTRTDAAPLGPLPVRIGESKLFVLPSTSGAASAYWSEEPWRALADLVGEPLLTPISDRGGVGQVSPIASPVRSGLTLTTAQIGRCGEIL